MSPLEQDEKVGHHQRPLSGRSPIRHQKRVIVAETQGLQGTGPTEAGTPAAFPPTLDPYACDFRGRRDDNVGDSLLWVFPHVPEPDGRATSPIGRTIPDGSGKDMYIGSALPSRAGHGKPNWNRFAGRSTKANLRCCGENQVLRPSKPTGQPVCRAAGRTDCRLRNTVWRSLCAGWLPGSGVLDGL